MPRSSTSASSTLTADSSHFAYTIERGDRFHDEPTRLVGFRRVAIETMEPVLVNEDVDGDARPRRQAARCCRRGPAVRRCSCPSLVGGRATGVISLQNIDRENAFSEADVRLLTTLAGSLSVALENARLFEETRQRNAELALINEVQRGLVENLDMQAMYDLVGDRHPRHLRRADRRHRRARLATGTSSTSRTRSSAASGSRTSRWRSIGFRKHVDRDPGAAPGQRAHSTSAPPSSATRSCIQGGRRASVLFVPLVVGAKATGVILLAEPRPGARVQRRRRPAPVDPRRQPQRRARERAAVRGDPPAQRRAGADQRRPARARAEPRYGGDVQPASATGSARSSTPRSWTSGSWTRATACCASPTRSNGANGSRTSRSTLGRGLRRSRARDAGTV